MATKSSKRKKPAKRSPNKPASRNAASKPGARKQPASRPSARQKTASNPSARKKPVSKPASRPGGRTASTTDAAKSIYDDLGNVAGNVESFGLPRALEICVDMLVYEFQPELKKLEQAAIEQLAARDFAPVVAAAQANRVAAFTEADAETMLRGLAEADDHYEPMQE